MQEEVRQSGHVLLLEDERPTRITLKRKLERSGFTVHEMADVKQAIERAVQLQADHGPEFVGMICDINVENGTGFELHDHVLKHLPANRHPGFSFLFLTSNPDNHKPIRERMRTDPRVDFVDKLGPKDPFQEIPAAFRRLVSRNRQT